MRNLIVICTLSVFVLFSCNKSREKEKLERVEPVKIEKEVGFRKTKGLLVSDQNIFKDLIIKKGDILNKKIIFINKGKEKVEILEYTSSCNCTKLNVSKTQIYPRDSTFVEILIDTKDKAKGFEKVTATLKTNGERTFYFLSVNFEIVE